MEFEKTFKVVLLGGAGVGKTAFIKRHITGNFEPRYIPTLGVEVWPLHMQTPQGPICFNVWDCAGQEKFSGLRGGYWLGADAVIFMYDVMSESSFYEMFRISKEFNNMISLKTIPVVICGNKVDCPDHKVPCILFTGDYCIDISVKSGYHMDRPFLSLAEKLSSKFSDMKSKVKK